MERDSTSPASSATPRIAQLTLDNGAVTSVYPYEDVTALLENATKDMNVGQLIQVESFSLFDAMCAIVIMDPKMDTGMVLDDYLTRPQYDVNRLLSPREFIWIFDNILVGQMTWLSGHALSQTLFTSCYILRLFEIELDEDPARNELQDQHGHLPQLVSLVLKPCVLAIAKSCGLILEEMRKGHVYEEEDFMTNSFGVSLYESFPVASLIGMLDQAEYWMQNAGSQWIQTQYEDQEATDLIQSIKDRIYFSRSSFMALFQVVAPKCLHFHTAIGPLDTARLHLQRIKATQHLGDTVDGAFDHAVHRKLVTNTPPRAIALLTPDETFDQLDHMFRDLTSIANALQFPDTGNLVNFFIHFGAQKPAPGAFPRSILQTVLYEERVIMGSRPVHIVVRDSIQETVAPTHWIFKGFDALYAKMDAEEPSSLETILEVAEDEISSLKTQIQAKAVAFVEKAVKPFVDTLQVMGQNTSRQRRNLRKIVLLWETLQEEAETFDEEIHMVLQEIQEQQQLQQEQERQQQQEEAEQHGEERQHEAEATTDTTSEISVQPFYFVSWVYHMKLWVMEWMLLLGAELELYSDFEYSMVYGYVDDLMSTHAQHLQRVKAVSGTEAQGSETQKKKKKKKKKVDGPSTEALSCETVTLEIAMVKAKLARALFMVFAALTKLGHLSTAPPHLASHGLNDLDTLFAHRFKAFRYLASPRPLNYPTYLNRIERDGSMPSNALEYASNLFDDAKRSLDRLHGLSARDARAQLCEDAWRKDIKGMAKVCIASKVAIHHLEKDARVQEFVQWTQRQEKEKSKAKGRASDPPPNADTYKAPARKVCLEWHHHPWWPIIILKP
ncbi:unnamed protein product [Mortierella alpina]